VRGGVVACSPYARNPRIVRPALLSVRERSILLTNANSRTLHARNSLPAPFLPTSSVPPLTRNAAG
jgi:hypothetical protein